MIDRAAASHKNQRWFALRGSLHVEVAGISRHRTDASTPLRGGERPSRPRTSPVRRSPMPAEGGHARVPGRANQVRQKQSTPNFLEWTVEADLKPGRGVWLVRNSPRRLTGHRTALDTATAQERLENRKRRSLPTAGVEMALSAVRRRSNSGGTSAGAGGHRPG
jgi:hypothetical protein